MFNSIKSCFFYPVFIRVCFMLPISILGGNQLRLWLGLFTLGVWVLGKDFLLGRYNLNVVGQGNLGSLLASNIVVQHNLDLDAEHTLSEEHVSHGNINVIVLGLTRVDHPAVDELHALGSLATQLAADNHFTALGTGFHDEAKNTVASTTHSKTANEFVTQTLALGNSAKTALRDFQCKQLKAGNNDQYKMIQTQNLNTKTYLNFVFSKAESLLHQRCQFTNSTTLFAQHRNGVSGQNDDASLRGEGVHLQTTVPIFGEFTTQELVQFSLKDSLLNKLYKSKQTKRKLAVGS